MKFSVVVALCSLMVVGSMATPFFGGDDRFDDDGFFDNDFFDDDDGFGGRLGMSSFGGSQMVGFGGRMGAFGGRMGGYKKSFGKRCNQGYIHKPIYGKGFGKGYGSKFGSQKFGPVFGKTKMFTGASNMYHSSPVVSATSMGGYPSYKGSSMGGSYPSYHGSSMGGSYPSYQGSSMTMGGSYPSYQGSSMGGSYPSYQGSNMYQSGVSSYPQVGLSGVSSSGAYHSLG